MAARLPVCLPARLLACSLGWLAACLPVCLLAWLRVSRLLEKPDSSCAKLCFPSRVYVPIHAVGTMLDGMHVHGGPANGAYARIQLPI